MSAVCTHPATCVPKLRISGALCPKMKSVPSVQRRNILWLSVAQLLWLQSVCVADMPILAASCRNYWADNGVGSADHAAC
jgi:hypothetical protein